MNYSEKLIDFIDRSPTQFHAVKNASIILKERGFTALPYNEKWTLNKGGRYFVNINNTAIAAFTVPENPESDMKFSIIGSHTDSPCIKVKPDASMIFENAMLKVNTEIYGGPLLYTWFDRPLSLAGIVYYRDGDKISYKIIDFVKPAAVIPSVAIHLNREVNKKGLLLNFQKDIIPLMSAGASDIDDKNYFISILSKEAEISPDLILDYDLSFYDVSKSEITGVDGEMILASRLDNLSMFFNSIEAISESSGSSRLNMVIGFDNEEVGSKSSRGADSSLVSSLLERIWYSLSLTREDLLVSTADSFILSADLSHAIHPNNPDKNDPLSKNLLNRGIVIKYNYNQKYSTDSETASLIIKLCNDYGIPYQKFVNNSEIPSGSTIGPHISSAVGAKCIDLGVCALSMHSVKELGGIHDFEASYKFMKIILEYFSMEMLS